MNDQLGKRLRIELSEFRTLLEAEESEEGTCIRRVDADESAHPVFYEQYELRHRSDVYRIFNIQRAPKKKVMHFNVIYFPGSGPAKFEGLLAETSDIFVEVTNDLEESDFPQRYSGLGGAVGAVGCVFYLITLGLSLYGAYHLFVWIFESLNS
jgi:hypothetical protein